MNTIDQWEAEAQEGKQFNQDVEFRERILTLIDLIRKKDEALKYYSNGMGAYINTDLHYIKDGISKGSGFYGTGKLAEETLLLTDKLK